MLALEAGLQTGIHLLMLNDSLNRTSDSGRMHLINTGATFPNSSGRYDSGQNEKGDSVIPYGDGNFGCPLHDIEGFDVPTHQFFIRSNGPVPIINAAEWRLTIDGLVERPSELSLADLRALPTTTLNAFLECAGNGRTRFDPPTDGTSWKNDAVGNATWEGVSLRDVLELAGIKPDTQEIVSQGGDFAKMNRGLPIEVAQDPDTMLVFGMNGEPLTPEHGAPVRLFVPGWAGISSTKWLVSLTAIDRPWDGFYNVQNYVLFDEAGKPIRAVRTMPVKSTIATPAEGAVLPPGPAYITGFAWSGDAAVDRVEVSLDGGESYVDAPIVGATGPHAWVKFQMPWDAAPGTYRLRSRAHDRAGHVQPEQAFWNLKGYQMNGILEVNVRVKEKR
jgi:DMSO/TMAO reductase YedYZ molybdopterin-dependent catalytic subunit